MTTEQKHTFGEPALFASEYWGFGVDVPDWAIMQAMQCLDNIENSKRIGKLLVEQDVLSQNEVDSLELKKKPGTLLGTHICKVFEDANDETKRASVQRAICALGNERILYIENFPNEHVVPHPILTESKSKNRLLQECHQEEAIPVRIANQTDAVLFCDVDKAKQFRDSYPRQKQVESVIWQEMKNFKVVIGSKRLITSYLSDSTDVSVLEETKKQSNTVTETSLQSSSEHRKIAAIWNRAIAKKVTDIHFEPSSSEDKQYVKVRFRIFGELIDFTNEFKLTYDEYKVVLGKICQLTGAIQTAGTRIVIPLDPDNINYLNSRGSNTFRLSIVPKGFGEQSGREQKSFVFRLFSDDSADSTFENLNVRPKIAELLRQLVKIKSKLHLTIGTTGSGKSSLIAAMLGEYNDIYLGRKKLYSLEDPVERTLSFIQQIQIPKLPENEVKKLGTDNIWAAFLSALMRHDPDCIFLGEIRDAETAGIAGQFASTGHELFSTFHATNPKTAVFRILDMFEKSSQRTTFIDSLGSVTTQRLVKKLCSCSHKRHATKQEIADINFKLSIDLEDIKPFKLEEGCNYAFQNFKGCKECDFTGVETVVPVNGVLVIDAKRRRKLLSKDEEIFYSAFEDAEFSLEHEFMDMVKNHVTSPMEI